jgi:hypothetical protein
MNSPAFFPLFIPELLAPLLLSSLLRLESPSSPCLFSMGKYLGWFLLPVATRSAVPFAYGYCLRTSDIFSVESLCKDSSFSSFA